MTFLTLSAEQAGEPIGARDALVVSAAALRDHPEPRGGIVAIE
jgi:hypothetical protein